MNRGSQKNNENMVNSQNSTWWTNKGVYSKCLVSKELNFNSPWGKGSKCKMIQNPTTHNHEKNQNKKHAVSK
jgi:HKD family nuclease